MPASALSLKEAFYYGQSGLSTTPPSKGQHEPQSFSLGIRNESLPLVLTEDVE
jgi:hypothetical protein